MLVGMCWLLMGDGWEGEWARVVKRRFCNGGSFQRY
jgi:hypothetical protein